MFALSDGSIYAFCFADASVVYALRDGANNWQTIAPLPTGIPLAVQYDAAGHAVALWGTRNSPNAALGLEYYPLVGNASLAHPPAESAALIVASVVIVRQLREVAGTPSLFSSRLFVMQAQPHILAVEQIDLAFHDAALVRRDFAGRQPLDPIFRRRLGQQRDIEALVFRRASGAYGLAAMSRASSSAVRRATVTGKPNVASIRCSMRWRSGCSGSAA